MPAEPTRRDAVRAIGAGATAGLAALAGCPSGQEAEEGKPRVPSEPNYRGWFDGVSNYAGTIDAQDQSTVSVAVGTQGNNGYFAFGPAAVAVSPGTTVRWEWTGRGGAHNVVADQETFDSGSPVDNETETFEQVLDSPAIYRYVCEPHVGVGMRGAVFVALGQPSDG